MVNRRIFLQHLGTTLLPLGALVTWRSAKANLRTPPSLPEVASQAVTVAGPAAPSIGMLSACLSLIQQFSASDGGMSAFLSAQLGLQKVALDLLFSVQETLADLTKRVARLSKEIEEVARWQHHRELVAQIIAAGNLYSEFLKASQEDAGVLESSETVEQLALLLNALKLSRGTLAAIPEGYGPESALVIPIAASLEAALQARVNPKRALLVEIGKTYLRWFTRMLSDEEGSIPAYIKRAYEEQNTSVSNAEALQVEVPRRFLVETNPRPVTFKGFLKDMHLAAVAKGTESGAKTPVLRIWSASTPTTEIMIKGITPSIVSTIINQSGHRQTQITMYGELKRVPQYQLGATTIEMHRSWETIRTSGRGSAWSDTPPPDNIPAIQSVRPQGRPDEVTDLDLVFNNRFLLDLDKECLARFETALKEVNLHRLRIAFGARALAVAAASKSRTRHMLRDLGQL